MGFFAPDGKVARFLNALGNLIILNILTLIFCLPVITAGASLCALFTVTMRIVRKEEGMIIQGYWEAFVANFKKSTLVWIIYLSITLFLAFDIYILMRIDTTAMLVYRVVLLILIILISVVMLHFLVLQARFENTIKETLKNAVIVSAAKHILSVLMLAVMLMPFLLYMVSLRFLSLGFLLGLSGPAYIVSIYFVSVLKTIEGNDEP